MQHCDVGGWQRKLRCVLGWAAVRGSARVPRHGGLLLFCELLMLPQEEFGFASDDGRTTLPCDAAVMEYVIVFA